MNRTEGYPARDAAPSSAAPQTVIVSGKANRLIAVISCASDSGIDLGRLKQLLFFGLAVLAVFEVAEYAFPILSGPSRTLPPLPFQIFNLVLVSVAALGVPWIGRNWRWWTFGFCLVLMISVTVAGLVVDEDDPVLMTLFVLIITSAVSIPWDARWQGALGLVALGSFTLSAMIGAVERNDLQQWLILAALMAFAATFAALKSFYRRQQWLVVDLEKSRTLALSASKSKSEFLSSMSHEIRTPMNAILGMSELLAETELSSDQQHYLDIMVANGNALLELINSILDLARIESGRMQIERTEFDLSDLIGQTLSTFGASAHGKGLELAAHIAPGVPDQLVGDPLRLRQVLVNLIGNAIKFTELGQVVLEVEHTPAQGSGVLLFTVADTGIGIPPDKLESIFANFTQADSSTTRTHGGSGLGLAIAQRLVTMMGGQISLHSVVNQGSKFSFAIHFDTASRKIAPNRQVMTSLIGYRVLVVDDHQVNRLIAREMMMSCGAEVGEAGSGEQALAAVHEAHDNGRPYRIILLDMRMPGMDGLEVARRIREDHLPVEPLILMLSSDDLKPQIELRDLALDAYLVKPITRKELFEAIYRILKDSNRESARPMPLRQAVSVANGATDDLPKKRVLVAEDSPDNRMVISAFLRREPFEIDFAENGEIALRRFQSQVYDLVLMDIQMPKMDGLAATRGIRQWEADHAVARTPIIALTASVLEDEVRAALAAGCNLHLGKPIKKLNLLEAMRNATQILPAHTPITVPIAETNGAAVVAPAKPQTLLVH
jgi:signal transduction histidine kinase/CheY-like chemotaxis protein